MQSRTSRIHQTVYFLPICKSITSMVAPDLHLATLFRAVAVIVLLRFCTAEDAQFRNCTRLFSCGPGIRGIDYPFWGGDRPRECGANQLGLRCGADNSTTIDIGGQKFRVLHVDVGNNSMTIAQSDLFGDICVERFRLSPSVDGYFDGDLRLRYSPGVENLHLLYSCSGLDPHLAQYNFSCSTNGTDRVAYAVGESLLGFLNATRCKHNISVPVMRTAWQELVRNGTVTALAVEKVVRRGVEVEYRMNGTTVCDRCKNSRGLCWSRTNSLTFPYCLCPGGPRQFDCNYPEKRKRLGLKIGIGVGAAAFGAIVMFIIFFVYHQRHKKRFAVSSLASHGSSSHLPCSKELEKAGVHMFAYHELQEATDRFDPQREIGDGGYGTVYRGKLQDGRDVAVKRLHEYHYRRVEQFVNEVEILTRLKHQNLVTLYGCTSYSVKDLLLVYEYIPNGTLADHLHGTQAKPGSPSWIARLNIAVETASALAYLHASEVIHRDIKSTNILLDNNCTVKVADFGISRVRPTDATHVSTAPQGTPGYLDPEYGEFYQLTEKSDVYSFGVVLMELISSKPAVDISRHRNEINLSTMAINKIQRQAVHELVDPHLGFESDERVRSMMGAVAELGFQCLQIGRDMRPDMQDVLDALQEIQRSYYTPPV